jgi:hypothetical protein
MITLNNKLPDGQLKPRVHKGDDTERSGKIMTKAELHAFRVGGVLRSTLPMPGTGA